MYSNVAAAERTDQVNGTIMLSFPKHDILQCEVFNTIFSSTNVASYRVDCQRPVSDILCRLNCKS